MVVQGAGLLQRLQQQAGDLILFHVHAGNDAALLDWFPALYEGFRGRTSIQDGFRAQA